ncbi:MAG: hypothetical protein ABJ387_03020 [Balneola sp.]
MLANNSTVEVFEVVRRPEILVKNMVIKRPVCRQRQVYARDLDWFKRI